MDKKLQRRLTQGRKQIEAIEDTAMSFPPPNFNPVVIDRYGAAWQFGGLNSPFWYRAYASDDPRDTREMSILGPFTVLGGESDES